MMEWFLLTSTVISVLIAFYVGVLYGLRKGETLIKLYKSKYELLKYAVNNPVQNDLKNS